LDKGIIINADIVVCLANVPLIGINLRAAIAGMETMVNYGMMHDYNMEKNIWLMGEEAEKQKA
jgi:gas vesicle structural protein